MPGAARAPRGRAVVRVKVWAKDGRSSTPTSRRSSASSSRSGAEEQELFEKGGAEAELSDLSQAREPLRAPGGQAARGAHADPHAERHAGPVRDLPAVRRRSTTGASACCGRSRRRCSPGCSSCCSSRCRWPGRWRRRLQRGHREREMPARERDRGLRPGAPPDRRRPPRRGRAGPRRRRVRARAAGRRRRRAAATSARRGAAAARPSTAAPGRPRPAHAARRDPPAEPRVGRAARPRSATC